MGELKKLNLRMPWMCVATVHGDGRQCRRRRVEGSLTCWQHRKVRIEYPQRYAPKEYRNQLAANPLF